MPAVCPENRTICSASSPKRELGQCFLENNGERKYDDREPAERGRFGRSEFRDRIEKEVHADHSEEDRDDDSGDQLRPAMAATGDAQAVAVSSNST